MTEEGDLQKVSKAENCQHKIYELKRVEHFNNILPGLFNTFRTWGEGGRILPLLIRLFFTLQA